MKLYAAAVFALSALPAIAGTSVLTAKVSAEKGTDFTILEGPGCNECGISVGRAHISQKLAEELLSHTDFLPFSPADGSTVPTRFLTKSSNVHTDHRYENGEPVPVTKGTPVAFVAVNTNENAYFNHGDDLVPIVKGQLFVFDGSIEHRTVVESGNVQFLGPFELPSFGAVGILLPPEVDCANLPATEEDCCAPGTGCILCAAEAEGSKSSKMKGKGKGKGEGRKMTESKKSKSKSMKKGKESSQRCGDGCLAGEEEICKNFYSFIPGGLEDVSTDPERLNQIVSDLDGNMDGDYGIVEDVLPLHELAILRNHADSALEEAIEAQVHGEEQEEEATNILEDFRFELSPSELASLIDLDSIRTMFNAFKDYANDFPVTRIIMRRTDLNGDKHIQYHNDGDTAVMHIWLNEDGVEGGNLVYLNNDGATKIETKPAAAALHANKIVHGITPLNGTRYILILLSDNKAMDDVMEAMVS